MKNHFVKFFSAIVLITVVFVLPFLFALRYIALSSGNIIFADDFNFISLISKYYEGHLTFSDLWAPYNGMRLIIGQFITLLNVIFLGWNNQIFMYFSLFVILGSAFLLYFYYKRNFHPQNRFYHFAAFLPVTLLLFSIRQWESLLFGGQLLMFAALFFLILTILLMQKGLYSNGFNKWFWSSILTSIIATFCFESAILVWVIVVIQILLSGLNKNNFSKIFIYSIFAIFIITIYFNNNGTGSYFTYFVHHLDRAIGFVLVDIGSSIIGEFSNSPMVTISFTFGVALVILYLIAIIIYVKSDKNDRNAMTFCLLLIIFSVIGSAITAYGRLELAFEQTRVGFAYAASSRYSTLNIIGVIGAYLFFLYYIGKYVTYSSAKRVYVSTFSIVTVLIIVGYSMSTFEELGISPYRRIYMESLRQTALSYNDEVPDEQLKPFNNPNLEKVRGGLIFIREKGLNVFKK